MPQGSLKVKTQLPKNVKKSSIHRGVNAKLKAIKKAPKKAKIKDANQRLQKEVEKAIRMNIEEEVRAKAFKDGKKLVTNEKINNSNN